MTFVDKGTTDIVPLTSNGFQTAGSLLTRAFINDPLYKAVIPDADKRETALVWLHQRVIQYCYLYGVMHTHSDAQGVACWLPPGQTDISMLRILRTGLFAMPFYMGLLPFSRFNAYMNVSDALRKKHAPEPYWYLWVLGVDPSSQRQGIGGRLMQPVLEQADKEGIPCYLETENEQNIGVYQRLGFNVVESKAIPIINITTWALLREPG